MPSAFIIKAIYLMIEAESISETSVNFSHATRRNNPDDSCLQDKVRL
jgi:hypothetical protein